MALDLGLHRHPDRTRVSLAPEELDSRRIVFWACYAIDKICAATLGRPVMLRREDADIDLPPYRSGSEQDEAAPWVDQARDFVSPATAVALSGVRRSHHSTFAARVRLAVILERIISSIYSVNRQVEREQDAPRILAELHAELQQWQQSLPAHLRWSTEGIRRLPPHVLSMHAWFHTCRLLLFRTFIPRLPAVRRRASRGRR